MRSSTSRERGRGWRVLTTKLRRSCRRCVSPKRRRNWTSRIAESEAFIKRFRESRQSLFRGVGRREWQDRGASCAVSGRWSKSTVGSGAHRVAPTSCSVTGQGSDLSSGSQHGLCPDEHGRSCSVDGRPSEGFAGGHVKWENPRCHKIGAVGRRWRSPVEVVDGRKSPFYGRQFSGHGAMSASLERFRINCESNRQERRVLYVFRGVRVGEASSAGPVTSFRRGKTHR